MKTKISKSQLEVWEWKEKLYEEIKNIEKNKRISFLINKSKETVNNVLKEKKIYYRNLNDNHIASVADSKK